MFCFNKLEQSQFSDISVYYKFNKSDKVRLYKAGF